MKANTDIMNFLDKLNKALKFVIVSVRPDHYRRGIGLKLIQNTMMAGKGTFINAALQILYFLNPPF